MYPKPIQNLIQLFAKFPGIGPKQAARFAFYILKEDERTIQDLTGAILNAKKNIGLCGQCYKTVDIAHEAKKGRGETGAVNCEYCSDESRDSRSIVIVEKEQDLINIERTKKYNGLYHVLGGTISPLDPQGPAKLHLKELFERIKGLSGEGKKVEIIIATNPTTEGDTTALYIERIVKPLGVTTSRLGRGLGTGAELEYADEMTIKAALEHRR